MKHQQAYIALITILIISAVTLLIAASAGLFGISETDMGLIEDQSTQSYYLANACAEYALERLKNNVNYAGDETLDIDDGSCYIYLPEGSGNEDRIIKATGTLANQTRKVKIIIEEINPLMVISSWQEVSEF